MAFNTFAFIVFFLVVLLCYAVFPKRYKWVFLLCASYFFYLYASVKFLAFILITTVSSWLGALWIQRLHRQEEMVTKDDRDPDVRRLKKQALKKHSISP